MALIDASDVCLSEEEAVAYVQSRLADDARARVEGHIDGCAGCRWLVSELARGSGDSTGAGDPAGAAGDARSAGWTPSAADPDDDVLRRGQRAGRFVIGRRLGSGGMGVVHAAYDPELDREVALKVLRPGAADDPDARARLLAEARAMARLSHRGVVPIYEVGTVDQSVVLAMEMVDGQDALKWLEETRPPWQRAVAVLSQAGRGLAAAHAAGIVHRDVKPSNILVDRDGGARITDFGLARAAPRDGGGPDDETPAREPAAPLGLTRTGAIVGTPAYMAPERHLGLPGDVRSDQFSFCVLLYEAVYRERPFFPPDPGPTFALEDLAAEVTAGRVRPPPKRSRVPGWLRRMLLRGLSVDPAARWPSVAALLDALAAAPRRRRRRWLVAGAIASVLALGAAALSVSRRAEVCTGAAALLEETWTPAARAAALARIAGLGAYGRALAPRLEHELDGHAARWVAGHRDACRAHERGEQSDDLLDRRMACLERSRAALVGVAGVLGAVDPRTVPGTILAARSLPDPSACSDAGALLASVRPPAAEIAGRAAGIDATLERALVELGAGRAAQARTIGVAAVTAARALGYRPLVARALLVEGRAAMDLDDRARAGPALAEATAVGIEVGDDALAVEAWARRAWAEGTGGQDPDRALAGLDLIEAMAARSRSSFARALLHNNLGAVAFSRGRRDEARAWHERALSEARGVTGPNAVEMVNVRANAASAIDDPARRDALLAEVESELDRLLGADHPQTLSLRLRRAMWIPELAAARELLGSTCAAYERFHHALAAAAVIECWGELGYVDEELGDHEGAVAAMTRAADLPVEASAVSAEVNGYARLWRGDARAAVDELARVVAALPRQDSEPLWTTFERGKLAVALGRARLSAGDPRGARVALEQAVADLDRVRRAQPAAIVERRLARAHAEL
ncbi:MAG TPA: protein kinase, partial [Kofleriaceae bacterium]|nr:protein kinase [Kofleriaceae bacterium]